MATGYADLIFDTPPGIVLQTREVSGGALPVLIPPAPNNYLRGVRWSPDGACLLTARSDNWFRLYDLSEDALERPVCGQASGAAGSPIRPPLGDCWAPQLVISGAEFIYDYAWYPGMSASDPSTCVFAHTGKATTVKLQDACDGKVRGSYRAYDDKDEITAAYSVGFSRDGTRLYAGYRNVLRIFDVSCPGRDCQVVNLSAAGGLRGIVSCMDTNPFMPDMLVVGAYSRYIAVLDAGTMETQYVLGPTKGGVTQVQFSRDGYYLYSGGRQDPHIHCWDIRSTCQTLYSLERDTASTTQRVLFDIEPCGRHLASGGQDGSVRVFDLASGAAVANFGVADDVVNGFQFHPYLPLAATATGDRNTLAQLPMDYDDPCPSSAPSSACSSSENLSDGDEDSDQSPKRRAWDTKSAVRNALTMWRFPFVYVGAEEADAVAIATLEGACTAVSCDGNPGVGEESEPTHPVLQVAHAVRQGSSAGDSDDLPEIDLRKIVQEPNRNALNGMEKKEKVSAD
eukprot:jgi/Botrbrau1/16053/Bobra.7_2s0027.1